MEKYREKLKRSELGLSQDLGLSVSKLSDKSAPLYPLPTLSPEIAACLGVRNVEDIVLRAVHQVALKQGWAEEIDSEKLAQEVSGEEDVFQNSDDPLHQHHMIAH